MKKKLLIIGLVAMTGWFGCGKKNVNTQVHSLSHPLIPQRSLSTANVSLRVKELVNSNTIIDVDIARVSSPSSNLSDEDYAEMKAAIYRFYKNVKLENGKYVYLGTDGAKGVKLSERVFDANMKSLNDMNKGVEAARLRGDSVSMPPVDDAYLNSLLN